MCGVFTTHFIYEVSFERSSLCPTEPILMHYTGLVTEINMSFKNLLYHVTVTMSLVKGLLPSSAKDLTVG